MVAAFQYFLASITTRFNINGAWSLSCLNLIKNKIYKYTFILIRFISFVDSLLCHKGMIEIVHWGIHHSHHRDTLLCIDAFHTRKIYCKFYRKTKPSYCNRVPSLYRRTHIFVCFFSCTADILDGIFDRTCGYHMLTLLSTENQ